MAQDLEAGRYSEVELFSGTVLKLGAKHGMDTPVNEMLYEKVNAIMQGGHCALLEHLAAKLAKAVLADARIFEVTVQVEKSMADMGTAKVPAVVKITRKAKDYEK